MFTPQSVGVGLSSEVGLVEGGVGVFDVARPYVLAVAVDGVFACIAGPHSVFLVKDDGLELIRSSLGYGFEDRFFRGLES